MVFNNSIKPCINNENINQKCVNLRSIKRCAYYDGWGGIHRSYIIPHMFIGLACYWNGKYWRIFRHWWFGNVTTFPFRTVQFQFYQQLPCHRRVVKFALSICCTPPEGGLVTWALRHSISPATRLFSQELVQAKTKLYQSCALLALLRVVYQWLVYSPHKGPALLKTHLCHHGHDLVIS